MNQLSKYEAAKQALAAARSIDEVKDIRDKAMAVRLYAQQAKDRSLEGDALEIRFRAERRLGELMEERSKAGMMAKPGPVPKDHVFPQRELPTLASQGIDVNLAHRARTLARMPEPEFEAKVAGAKKDLVASLSKENAEKSWASPETAEALINRLILELHTYNPSCLSSLRQASVKLIARIDQQLNQEKVTWLSSQGSR